MPSINIQIIDCEIEIDRLISYGQGMINMTGHCDINADLTKLRAELARLKQVRDYEQMMVEFDADNDIIIMDDPEF